MEDDQTLEEEEGEGCQVEVNVEPHDDIAGRGEVADDVGGEDAEEAHLETNLCDIVRVETTETGNCVRIYK